MQQMLEHCPAKQAISNQSGARKCLGRRAWTALCVALLMACFAATSAKNITSAQAQDILDDTVILAKSSQEVLAIYQEYLSMLDEADAIELLLEQILKGEQTFEESEAAYLEIVARYKARLDANTAKFDSLELPQIKNDNFRQMLTGMVSYVKEFKVFVTEYFDTFNGHYTAARAGAEIDLREMWIVNLRKTKFTILGENRFLAQQKLLINAEHPQVSLLDAIELTNEVIADIIDVVVAMLEGADRASQLAVLTKANKKLDEYTTIQPTGLMRAQRYISSFEGVLETSNASEAEKKTLRIVIDLMKSYGEAFAVEADVVRQLRVVVGVVTDTSMADMEEEFENHFLELEKYLVKRIALDAARREKVANMRQ